MSGGNPPTKEQSSKVEFSSNAIRRFCNEEITFYRKPDEGGLLASLILGVRLLEIWRPS
jgi:hypothetical protein